MGFANDIAIVVTSRTASVLELKMNETRRRRRRRRIDEWLRNRGLELTVQNTDAILIKNRRHFRSLKVLIQNKTVKYPGCK